MRSMFFPVVFGIAVVTAGIVLLLTPVPVSANTCSFDQPLPTIAEHTGDLARSATLVAVVDVIAEVDAIALEAEGFFTRENRPSLLLPSGQGYPAGYGPVFVSTLEIRSVLSGTAPDAPLRLWPLGTFGDGTCRGGERLLVGQRVLIFLIWSDSQGQWIGGTTRYHLEVGEVRLSTPFTHLPGAGDVESAEALIHRIGSEVRADATAIERALALARAAPRALPSAGSGGLASESGHTLPTWALQLALAVGSAVVVAGTSVLLRARRGDLPPD